MLNGLLCVQMYGGQEIAIVHTGQTFAPYAELVAGGSLLWLFADGTTSTSPTPSKDFGSARRRTTRLRVGARSLRSLNLGYDGGDSAGAGHMPTLFDGSALPYVGQQNVVEIRGLQHVAASLVNLAVSNNVGIQRINASGMRSLQFIEAFYAFGLRSVNVSRCSSIRRICCEGCPIDYWDLSDVPTLEDFRNRTGYNPGTGTVYSTWSTVDWGNNSRAHLWHYCVGSNPNILSLGAWSFPALTQAWWWGGVNVAGTVAPISDVLPELQAWSCGYTDADLSRCPRLQNVDLRYCQLTQSAIDRILADLVSHGRSNGIVRLSGNPGSASAVGLVSAATLESRGWTVVL